MMHRDLHPRSSRRGTSGDSNILVCVEFIGCFIIYSLVGRAQAGPFVWLHRCILYGVTTEQTTRTFEGHLHAQSLFDSESALDKQIPKGTPTVDVSGFAECGAQALSPEQSSVVQQILVLDP